MLVRRSLAGTLRRERRHCAPRLLAGWQRVLAPVLLTKLVTLRVDVLIDLEARHQLPTQGTGEFTGRRIAEECADSGRSWAAVSGLSGGISSPPSLRQRQAALRLKSSSAQRPTFLCHKLKMFSFSSEDAEPHVAQVNYTIPHSSFVRSVKCTNTKDKLDFIRVVPFQGKITLNAILQPAA